MSPRHDPSVVKFGIDPDRVNGWPRLADSRKRPPEWLREELAAVEALAAALIQLPDQKSRARAIRLAQEYARAHDAAARETSSVEPIATSTAAPLDETAPLSSAAPVEVEALENGEPVEPIARVEPVLTADDVERLFDRNLPPPELRPLSPRRKKRSMASIIPRVIARNIRKRGLQVVFLVQVAASKLV